MESNSSIGKIISVSDLNVKVLLNENSVKIKDILYYENENNEKRRFEVVEIESNIAMAVPFESVQGVKKGIDLFLEPGGLQIEYSSKILGRMFNSYGDLIDNGPAIKKKTLKNVYERKLTIKDIDIS